MNIIHRFIERHGGYAINIGIVGFLTSATGAVTLFIDGLWLGAIGCAAITAASNWLVNRGLDAIAV